MPMCAALLQTDMGGTKRYGTFSHTNALLHNVIVLHGGK